VISVSEFEGQGGVPPDWGWSYPFVWWPDPAVGLRSKQSGGTGIEAPVLGNRVKVAE